MNHSSRLVEPKGSSSRPNWQLPEGVSRGAWDYVNEPSIATDYDRFHAGHPLLDLDQEIIANQLGAQPFRPDGSRKIAVDCGCGTGRNLLPLAAQGWRVIGVDLSSEMLRAFRIKADQSWQDRVCTVRANMADIGFLKDSSTDAVLCMYSSIGMLQGRSNRRNFLGHAARILRDDGSFMVHVHNRGSWLRDPGGVRRTLRDWWRSKREEGWELGDSVYAYRGLPTMFLHIYSERELLADLSASGFVLHKLYRLNRTSSQVLRRSWFKHLRSGGFIAVCRRKSKSPTAS
jgi:ubiquinone/menaquinone biosynthesis C-methylase UbiE